MMVNESFYAQSCYTEKIELALRRAIMREDKFLPKHLIWRSHVSRRILVLACAFLSKFSFCFYLSYLGTLLFQKVLLVLTTYLPFRFISFCSKEKNALLSFFFFSKVLSTPYYLSEAS